MGAARRDLIRNLWPDKALYGSVLLVTVGVVGIVWALLVSAADIRYGEVLPETVRTWPLAYTLLASAGAAGLAMVALAGRAPLWGLLASGFGVAALGFAGFGAILSLVAAAFFLMSIREGEGRSAATRRLTARDWPDKALAAGMLSVVNGLFTVGWGAALGSGAVVVEPLGAAQQSLGTLAGLAGLFSLATAVLLYHQRAPLVGVLAALACIGSLGFLVVGPLLGAGTLLLLALARREAEFGGAPLAVEELRPLVPPAGRR